MSDVICGRHRYWALSCWALATDQMRGWQHWHGSWVLAVSKRVTKTVGFDQPPHQLVRVLFMI